MKFYYFIIFIAPFFSVLSNSLNEKFEYFIDKYEEEHGIVDKTPFEILNYKKINQLSFKEGLELYQASRNKKNIKYIISSLERLYFMAQDSQVAEIILFKLIEAYFEFNKDAACFNASDQFIKLFPGSKGLYDVHFFYIKSGYNASLSEFHDSIVAEKTLAFARMMYDSKRIKKNDFDTLIDIINNLFKLLIIKEYYILDYYYDKWYYTFDNMSIFSCLIRLENIRIIIMQSEPYKEIEAYTYISSLLSLINAMFLQYSIILPCGENYEESREILVNNINKNRKHIRTDLIDLIKKLKKIKK